MTGEAGSSRDDGYAARLDRWMRASAFEDAVEIIEDLQDEHGPAATLWPEDGGEWPPGAHGWFDYLVAVQEGSPWNWEMLSQSQRADLYGPLMEAVGRHREPNPALASDAVDPSDPTWSEGWRHSRDALAAEMERRAARRSPEDFWDEEGEEMERHRREQAPSVPLPEPPEETFIDWAFGFFMWIIVPALIIAGISKVFDLSMEAAGAVFVVGFFIVFVVYYERR